MSEKKTKLSRRDFLAQSAHAGLTLTVLDTVVASLLSSYSRPAMAANATAFKYFLHVNAYGSAPRWHYDLILNPSGKDTDFMENGQVKNVYTGTTAGYSNGAYKLTKYDNTNIYVPYLLGLKVPTSRGEVKAWNLLDSMIQIRGVDVLNAAHPGASNLHQAGVAGAPTLTSLTADRASSDASDPTKNSVRSMMLNPTPGSIYKSAAGSNQFSFSVAANGSNALNSIFSSMRPISSTNKFGARFIANNDALSDKISTALQTMDPAAKQYYQSVLESGDKANKILRDETIAIFTQLGSEWTELYERYKGLIDQVYKTEYALINDRLIGKTPANAVEQGWYGITLGSNVENKDAKGRLDMRTILGNQDITRLAAQFAVTEFLITRGISPSVSLNPVSPSRLMINGSSATMPMDQHQVGFMVGIMMNSIYHLAFSSCMLELIDVLKAKNIYKDTLIYWASEFNRAPRTDGSGADHGPQAAHVNLLSGRIDQFQLIGNIYKNGAAANTNYRKEYQGTWGVGAPIDGKTKPINIVQVWGSVAASLGMAISELPNAVDKSALIFNEAGSLKVASPYSAKAKNIDNGKTKA